MKWGEPSMVNIFSKGRYKINDSNICYIKLELLHVFANIIIHVSAWRHACQE